MNGARARDYLALTAPTRIMHCSQASQRTRWVGRYFHVPMTASVPTYARGSAGITFGDLLGEQSPRCRSQSSG